MNSNGSRKFTNGSCRPVAYRVAYGERQLRAICAMSCGDVTLPLRKNLSIPAYFVYVGHVPKCTRHHACTPAKTSHVHNFSLVTNVYHGSQFIILYAV